MAPFYGWGSTTSWLQPLRGGSLLFTIQFKENSGTHFIYLCHYKKQFGFRNSSSTNHALISITEKIKIIMNIIMNNNDNNEYSS